MDERSLLALLDRPIAFHRALVAPAGSVLGALMLSQALYWRRRTSDPDGWFFKTREEWLEETGLDRPEQEAARRGLRASGFWEEERRGLPARLYFRVDLERLFDVLQGSEEECKADKKAETPPTRRSESHQLLGGKPANCSLYSETTAETTCREGEAAPAPGPACAREPAAPAPEGERLHVEALRLYHQYEDAIWGYFGTPPAGRQGQELIGALEYHLAQGRPPSSEQMAAAVKEAKTWCRQRNQGRPTVGALITALARVLAPEEPEGALPVVAEGSGSERNGRRYREAREEPEAKVARLLREYREKYPNG